MAKTKKCPWCKGAHRKRAAAKRCHDRHVKSTWTKQEIGA